MPGSKEYQEAIEELENRINNNIASYAIWKSAIPDIVKLLLSAKLPNGCRLAIVKDFGFTCYECGASIKEIKPEK